MRWSPAETTKAPTIRIEIAGTSTERLRGDARAARKLPQRTLPVMVQQLGRHLLQQRLVADPVLSTDPLRREQHVQGELILSRSNSSSSLVEQMPRLRHLLQA